MHLVEIGQAQENLTAQGFQATASIVGLVVKHGFADAVGPARGPFLRSRILTVAALTGHHANRFRRVMQDLRHAGGIDRRVLAIAIERNNQRRFGRKYTGAHGPALADIVFMPQHAQAGDNGLRRHETRMGLILTVIIDKDDLETVSAKGS